MESIYDVKVIKKTNYKKYLFTNEQERLICDLYLNN